MRSKLARRINVCLSARGEGNKFFFSNLAEINASIGLLVRVGLPSSTRGGFNSESGAWKDQNH